MTLADPMRNRTQAALSFFCINTSTSRTDVMSVLVSSFFSRLFSSCLNSISAYSFLSRFPFLGSLNFLRLVNDKDTQR